MTLTQCIDEEFIDVCNAKKVSEIQCGNDGSDVEVDQCYSHGNADLGIHPGSGSQRPLIHDCRIERNGIGLFWCWGVKYGLADGNRIIDSSKYGISIGHNDTNNVMRNNEIIGSGKVGILFRDDARGTDFWPNHNVVEDNRIENSGGPDGIAIDIRGKTKDVRLARNIIRETRQASDRVGVRISSAAQRIELFNNKIEGFATAIDDQRA